MQALPVEHDPELPVIGAVQQGDPHALAELMQRHDSWVRGVIFGALGRADEVDDVAQRVWVQVWREAGRLDDPGRWRVWLYRIARNAAADAGRRRQRRKKLLTGFLRRKPRAPITASPVEESMITRERRETTLQAIGNLPELYREPFVLRHLENWSYAQIAEAMGLPVDTVETRLVRARRLLRAELAGKV
jgi:RNA polymerase sigma-70 factor (ECF subfamily)